MCIFEGCDISFKNRPTSHAVSLALFRYACSGSAMLLWSCACLRNNRKWCLASLVSPFFCTVLILWYFLIEQNVVEKLLKVCISFLVKFVISLILHILLRVPWLHGYG